MKKKIIGILVCMLLIATALPAVGTFNIKEESTYRNSCPTSADVAWSDNFDSYSLGQFLDGDPEDGGWRLCGCPYQSDGAYVVDDQYLSSPHSVEILGITDIVHEFTRICSGNWTLTDWIYIPTDSTSVSAIALDSYHPTPWDDWKLMRQLAVIFNAFNGIVEPHPMGPTLPLITGQWVELRVEIDFEADWVECYYNDELLIEKNWTDDIYPGYTGYRNFAALTLCYTQSHGPIEIAHYHDDFFIEGIAGPDHELACEGSLSWTDVKPGETVTGNFIVENIGEPNSRLEWIIEEYPDFGTWTCEPSESSLTPEDGPVTVQVTVKAPNKKNENFTGELRLRAICDPDESCTIDVSLATPMNKPFNFNFPLLSWLFERFPHAFPILRHLLGL